MHFRNIRRADALECWYYRCPEFVYCSKSYQMESACKNCDLTLQPDFSHCPGCGQKTNLHRLGLHDIFHEGVHYFTHADKGLLTLIRDLAVKRGVVAREYINGQRKKYFSPLNFFLLVAALNLFAINADGNYVLPDVAEPDAKIAQLENPAKKAYWTHVHEKQQHAIFFIKKHSNLTVMVMLPIMALVFWLFYYRKQYNYAEHLVSGMYMYGFCTLVFACLALLNLIVKANPNYIYGFALVFQPIYYSNFYYRLFGNTMRKRAIFAALTSIFFIVVVNACAASIYMFGPW